MIRDWKFVLSRTPPVVNLQVVNDFKCPETQVEKLAYKFMHTHLELASFLTSCLLKLACQGWYGLFV